jgi:hypothetical protein
VLALVSTNSPGRPVKCTKKLHLRGASLYNLPSCNFPKICYNNNCQGEKENNLSQARNLM